MDRVASFFAQQVTQLANEDATSFIGFGTLIRPKTDISQIATEVFLKLFFNRFAKTYQITGSGSKAKKGIGCSGGSDGCLIDAMKSLAVDVNVSINRWRNRRVIQRALPDFGPATRIVL